MCNINHKIDTNHLSWDYPQRPVAVHMGVLKLPRAQCNEQEGKILYLTLANRPSRPKAPWPVVLQSPHWSICFLGLAGPSRPGQSVWSIIDVVVWINHEISSNNPENGILFSTMGNSTRKLSWTCFDNTCRGNWGSCSTFFKNLLGAEMLIRGLKWIPS